MHVVPSMRITESPKSRGAIFFEKVTLHLFITLVRHKLRQCRHGRGADVGHTIVQANFGLQWVICWLWACGMGGYVDFDVRLVLKEQRLNEIIIYIHLTHLSPMFSAKFRPFFPSHKPSQCDPMGMIHGHHQFSWLAAPPWPWLPHHLHAPPTTRSVRPQRAHARRGAPNVEGLLSRWQGHRGGPPRKIKGSVLRCLEISKVFSFWSWNWNTSLSLSLSLRVCGSHWYYTIYIDQNANTNAIMDINS